MNVSDFPETVPLTDAQQQELDRRLQAYRENPDEGISWDELKEQIQMKNGVN